MSDIPPRFPYWNPRQINYPRNDFTGMVFAFLHLAGALIETTTTQNPLQLRYFHDLYTFVDEVCTLIWDAAYPSFPNQQNQQQNNPQQQPLVPNNQLHAASPQPASPFPYSPSLPSPSPQPSSPSPSPTPPVLRYCPICNLSGHTYALCPWKFSIRNLFCGKCNFSGHVTGECDREDRNGPRKCPWCCLFHDPNTCGYSPYWVPNQMAEYYNGYSPPSPQF